MFLLLKIFSLFIFISCGDKKLDESEKNQDHLESESNQSESSNLEQENVYLALDETFIKQIELYIPKDQRIEFIKDYVRPHTEFDISFNESIDIRVYIV